MICQVSLSLLRIVFDADSAGWFTGCTIAGIVNEFDALGRKYTSSTLHEELEDVVLFVAESLGLADTSAVKRGRTKVKIWAREAINV